MEDKIMEMIKDSIATKQKTLALAERIAQSAKMLIDALRSGNKILVCGNGGSAADAQHMAGELVGRFEKDRRGLACIALTTDSSVITAWSNDYSYETVFSRQVDALGLQGDILIGISTSGNSMNIIGAFEEAIKKEMKSIALIGKDGGIIGNRNNIFTLTIPSLSTPRIQEAHITIIHVWCQLIEDELFS